MDMRVGPSLAPTSGRPAGRASLRLLGPFALRDAAGSEIALPTRKSRLLLAYLASQPGQPVARERLAALIWPDRADTQARGSLRNAMSALRSALGADLFAVGRETVCLPAGAVETDIARLEAWTADPEAVPLDAPLRLDFRPFLEGLPADEGELGDWLTFERARFASQAQALIHAVAHRFTRAGRNPEALVLARRLLAMDPLREQSHRLLMRLHAAMGEQALALAQFRLCKEVLRRELDVDPSPETVRVAAEIASPAPPPMPAPAPPSRRANALSIAVLPFADQGGDEEDQWLAAGLAEDILTELSRQRDFIVIARQSSFTLGTEETGSAASALGVRYVLTGAMRRAGSRLRVTVRLIDAARDWAVWAERYDRTVDDLFDVQDEIVRRIIANVDSHMRLYERERVAGHRPENLDAWGAFHKGLWHLYRFTPDEVASAEHCFRHSIASDPDFGPPHGGLACVALASLDRVPDTRASLAAGLADARRGVALAPNDAFCATILGRILIYCGEPEEALEALERAIAINASFAQAYYGLAQHASWYGDRALALGFLDEAQRLNPRDPYNAMMETFRAFTLYGLGDPEAALAATDRALRFQARENWAYLARAAALQALGRFAEARAAVATALCIDPGLTLAVLGRVIQHIEPDRRNRLLNDLAAAGLA